MVVRRAALKLDLRVVVIRGELLDACSALKTQAAGLEPVAIVSQRPRMDILTMLGDDHIGASPYFFLGGSTLPASLARRRQAADT
jgi:hypothetical protein